MAELIETDVLILGCGVAGGTVALQLADAGVPVILVTRAADPHDESVWGQYHRAWLLATPDELPPGCTEPGGVRPQSRA